MSLEVIIPVKDRAEVGQCVESLLAIEDIDQVWICDGGSQQPDCLSVLRQLDQDQRVHWLHVPQSGFNKSSLINQGILQATAQYLLISDADILWNPQTVQSLLQKVSHEDNLICSVAEVRESQPTTISLRRNRYTYRIEANLEMIQIEILPVDTSNVTIRPGCGLICTQRTNLIKLGGYQECFQGWGWEDQDLLMRAAIVGLQLEVTGWVVHLSHGDDQRNQHFHFMQPVESRDQNILTCLNQLATGKLVGDLPTATMLPVEHREIQIHVPDTLKI